MKKHLIASAAKKLDLFDIVLHETHLLRNNEVDPLNYPQDISQQGMLGVNTEELTYFTDQNQLDVLRFYVKFGIRAVSNMKENKKKSTKNLKVYFTIEATFRADYLKKKKLSKHEIEEFSTCNAVHNVWPFWRQHVFQYLKTAGLPHLNIPLMRNFPIIKINPKKVKKKPKKGTVSLKN